MLCMLGEFSALFEKCFVLELQTTPGSSETGCTKNKIIIIFYKCLRISYLGVHATP